MATQTNFQTAPGHTYIILDSNRVITYKLLNFVGGIQYCTTLVLQAHNHHAVSLQNTPYMLGYIFFRLLKSAANSQMSTGLEFGITTSNATSCVRVLIIKYSSTPNKQTHTTLFLYHLLCIVSGINQFNIIVRTV